MSLTYRDRDAGEFPLLQSSSDILDEVRDGISTSFDATWVSTDIAARMDAFWKASSYLDKRQHMNLSNPVRCLL